MPPTQPFRSLMPGPGTTAGVDCGMISGISEHDPSNINGVSISLTAAQIIAMYTTPVLLATFPTYLATTKCIVPLYWVFRIVRTSTAFTGGGAVNIQYGSTGSGGGTALGNTLPASVV